MKTPPLHAGYCLLPMLTLLASACGVFEGGKERERVTFASADQVLVMPEVESLELRFNPYPEPADSFRVYAGRTYDAEFTKVHEFKVTAKSFDAASPVFTLIPGENLRALFGRTVCFRLTAVVDKVESDASNVDCTEL